MKQLICALMLLIPFTGYSKDKGSKIQLIGNWKEVKRLNVAGKKINYTDTLYLKFEAGNQYVRQQGKGFIYRGVYKILSGSLDIGTRTYTILEYKKKKRLVLKDQMGTYELEPYVPVSQIVPGRAPEVYKPITSINQMVGSWDKFKGTSSGTHQQIDYTRTVKKVEIFAQPRDGKYGFIYAGRDGENAPSWYVESFSNQTLYCNGKDRRQFKVLKAENNELIIEGEGFTYFLRRFR